MKNIIFILFILLFFSNCKKEEEYYQMPVIQKQASLYYSYNVGDTFKMLSNTQDTFECVVYEKTLENIRVKDKKSNNKTIYSEEINLLFTINGEKTGRFSAFWDFDNSWYLYVKLNFNADNNNYYNPLGFINYDNYYSELLFQSKQYKSVFAFTPKLYSNNEYIYRDTLFTTVEDGLLYIKNDTISYTKID
jgi:hypothetical protein